VGIAKFWLIFPLTQPLPAGERNDLRLWTDTSYLPVGFFHCADSLRISGQRHRYALNGHWYVVVREQSPQAAEAGT
jgi:hypothetical protein